MKLNISIIEMGYIGASLAINFLNFKVIGFDKQKNSELKKGIADKRNKY